MLAKLPTIQEKNQKHNARDKLFQRTSISLLFSLYAIN